MEKMRTLPPERIAGVEDFVDFFRRREMMPAKTDPMLSGRDGVEAFLPLSGGLAGMAGLVYTLAL